MTALPITGKDSCQVPERINVAAQLEEIHAWLIQYEPQVVPKSLLGQAISYALSNWKALTVYIQDGRLEIDNNRSERCIKGVVLGRKNYMFMGSPRGGHAAATIYSLIETCKQNNVDPLLTWRIF